MIRISKSDYVLGLKCPTALWYKKFRKDLEPEMNEAVLETGTEVGILACDKFPNGFRIDYKPWEQEALDQTRFAMERGEPAIYEATFATSTGEYCAVDILRNNNDGTWDIVEVKSTTKTENYHYYDVSFQRYVLQKCGVNIKRCFIMTLNPDYVRHGELDVQELFKLHLVEEDFCCFQDVNTVENNLNMLHKVLESEEPPACISKRKCGDSTFYECGYKKYCWQNVPAYSVFNAFKADKADDVYEKFGMDVANVPQELYAKQLHKGDIEAFLANEEIINVPKLKEFVNKLKYPLYFLDYESIQPAIPMFDNSRPYQQIPFQFSLHVLRTPGGELEHYEYIHNNQHTDPRPELIKHLIEYCEDNDGSVVVYNKTAESTWNSQMARDFPEYAQGLNTINDRIIDLLIPFRQRDIYKPCQNGSASIKKTLPAFVPSMSYANLGIHNGTEASTQFMNFMTGKQTAEQTKKMMENLHEYCGQDTMAMVRLLDVIQGIL